MLLTRTAVAGRELLFPESGGEGWGGGGGDAGCGECSYLREKQTDR